MTKAVAKKLTKLQARRDRVRLSAIPSDRDAPPEVLRERIADFARSHADFARSHDRGETDTASPTTDLPKKARSGRFDRLLLWRMTTLPTVPTSQKLADGLSCEELPREDVPESMDSLVTSFRHLRRDARERVCRVFLT